MENLRLYILVAGHGRKVWLKLNWSFTPSNIDDLSFLCGLQTKNFNMMKAYFEFVWGIQILGSHWRIQVNFKKAKNEESSSSQVETLITHNSRILYLMDSFHMVDWQNIILILWPSTCSNSCKYFLAYFNLIILLLPWPRHRVKS